ncbi:helix-turn-helix transcriptional regulator [Lipingzhangella sp. LS1_29]|uniref:Helix-turn-helix transcriptional regulator n=2 Tax=Lipingzhangella rawalii TaxID=2055835 RepID=A0ABU2H4U5_9ACTN|nr:helix-turn-helix transcriptional regulator [Lipingzhangella rawalii]
MAISPESMRLRFGAEVRRFRQRAGLSQQQVALAVPMAQSHLSQLERGRKGTSEEQVPRLDSVLGAGGALMRRWEDLHKREDGYADWFRGTAELERTATLIRIHNPLVVPGLVQTEDYARTVIRFGSPADTPAEIEEQVAARMHRQEILEAERGPRIQLVLCESILRRNIGGRAIMIKQLDRLLAEAQRPRLAVQVLPLSSPDQPGLDGAFALFSAPDIGQVLYTETRIDGYPVDDPVGVEEYVQVFSELRAAALPLAASRELIERVRGEHADG